MLDEDDFVGPLDRAIQGELPVQEHGGRRTFVATNVGYRLELHPPRDWIEELLGNRDVLRLAELHLLAEDPAEKAAALADLLDVPKENAGVDIGGTVVRFLPGGPPGRPQLHAELFV